MRYPIVQNPNQKALREDIPRVVGFLRNNLYRIHCSVKHHFWILPTDHQDAVHLDCTAIVSHSDLQTGSDLASHLISHALLVPNLDASGFLWASDFDVHLEGERAADQVGSEVVALRPLGLTVGIHVGLELEAADYAAASDKKLGLGDLDTGTHAAAHAETVVAHESWMLGEGLLVGGVLRFEPTSRIVGLWIWVQFGVSGEGKINGVDHSTLG